MIRALVLLGLAVANSACSGGNGDGDLDASEAGSGPPPVALDAGAPDADIDAGPPVVDPDELPSGAILAAPMPPAAPVLTPCLPGWRLVAGASGDPDACEPYPESGRITCADGEAHYPGTAGCAPVGDACPPAAERFRTDFAAGTAVLYVDPAAPTGGDGTRAAPFVTIAAATAAAMPGTTIALAAADFDEAVVLPTGVDLSGACASRTHVTLSSATTPETPTVVITGTDVTVRNLSIAGAWNGILVDADARATIRGVALEGTTQCAFWVRDGGAATLDDVVMRDVIRNPGGSGTAFGIEIESGGSAEGRHVAVERTGPVAALAAGAGSRLVLSDSLLADGLATGSPARGGLGVLAQEMAHVELRGVVIAHAQYGAVRATIAGRVDGTDVVIEDTDAEPGVAESVGAAVVASRGGTVHLERTWIRRAQFVTLVSREADTRVELVDAIVEDTRTNDSGHGGGAGIVDTGGQLALTRVAIHRLSAIGFQVDAEGTALALTDVRISDLSPEPATGEGGGAVQILPGASLTVERLAIERATGTALGVFGSGSVTGTDVAVRETRAVASTGSRFRGFGLGIFASEGITVDLERVEVTGSVGVGVITGMAGTAVTLRDVRVAGTLPASDWPYADVTQVGRGIDVQTMATLSIDRGILDANHEVALFVSRAGTSAALHDLVVRDTGLDPATQSGGRALQATVGGAITGDLVRLERNREIAIASYGEGTRVELTNLEIFETTAPDCFPATCPDQGGGIGLAGYDHGAIHVEQFAIRGSILCGVQVAADASVDLAHGEVSGSEIGANVQVPGYDLDRLQNDVVYRDNVRALDATELPIPPAGVDLSEM